MKKRILFWTEYFWPFIGGAEIFAVQLIHELESRGFEFLVVTGQFKSSLPSNDEFNGIPIRRFPFQKALMGNFVLINEIKRDLEELKKDFKPDLIHANTTFPALFFDLITKKTWPAYRLMTLHGFHLLHVHSSSYLAQYLNHLDFLCSVSHATLEDLKRSVPSISCPSSIVHNGLIEPKISPNALNLKKPIIGIISRLSREKGLDVALRAFSEIAKKFPNIEFKIAGEGPERATLEKLSAELGLEKHLKFLGVIPPEEAYDFINQTTLISLPSRVEEGFPLVALQAALMGRPVVASRAGGLKEVVRDGITGILIEKENPQELQQALEVLLTHPEETILMGKNAKHWVREQFPFNKMIDSYEKIYDDLILGRQFIAQSISENK